MDVDTLDSPKVELETNVVEKETLVEKHTNGKVSVVLYTYQY